MKKVVQAENTRSSDFAFANNIEYGPLEFSKNPVEPPPSVPLETAILDKFLTLIKFVFLYVPGAAAIHLMMMGFALARFYDHWALEMIAGTVGIALVSAFMIVLGIGDLKELKYLRVVGAVAAASVVWATVYSILILFLPGDYFGLFAQLTLPLTLLAGYLVKRDTDYRERN